VVLGVSGGIVFILSEMAVYWGGAFGVLVDIGTIFSIPGILVVLTR
jgi:hypothetical protein